MGSFPRLSCSEVTPLPQRGLQDPTLWEAKQGKPFLAGEKKDLGGPLSSGDPRDPHRKQLQILPLPLHSIPGLPPPHWSWAWLCKRVSAGQHQKVNTQLADLFTRGFSG